MFVVKCGVLFFVYRGLDMEMIMNDVDEMILLKFVLSTVGLWGCCMWLVLS